jgi:cell pole-organizing protein PopZ
MEDILASIRRILSEDEAAPGSHPGGGTSGHAAPPADQAADGVLVLDPGMMVPDPPEDSIAAPPRPAEGIPPQGLVAPEAAAAAASSVGSLVRTIAAERTVQVHSGGPTIEDIVRQELRPLLKEWLSANLPPLVERLVRAEIERVVGRATP